MLTFDFCSCLSAFLTCDILDYLAIIPQAGASMVGTASFQTGFTEVSSVAFHGLRAFALNHSWRLSFVIFALSLIPIVTGVVRIFYILPMLAHIFGTLDRI